MIVGQVFQKKRVYESPGMDDHSVHAEQQGDGGEQWGVKSGGEGWIMQARQSGAHSLRVRS